MKLSLICALDRRRAIGLRGELLFYLPAALRHSKALTTGHTVLMGRRTFQSLPKGALPNRRNVVVSRNPAFTAEGAEVYPTMEAALAACEADELVFVIGGESVYAAALPLAHELCLTFVEASAPEADTYFPAYDEAEWQLVAEECHEPDERNAEAYRFCTFRRKPQP